MKAEDGAASVTHRGSGCLLPRARFPWVSARRPGTLRRRDSARPAPVASRSRTPRDSRRAAGARRGSRACSTWRCAGCGCARAPSRWAAAPGQLTRVGHPELSGLLGSEENAAICSFVTPSPPIRQAPSPAARECTPSPSSLPAPGKSSRLTPAPRGRSISSETARWVGPTLSEHRARFRVPHPMTVFSAMPLGTSTDPGSNLQLDASGIEQLKVSRHAMDVVTDTTDYSQDRTELSAVPPHRSTCWPSKREKDRHSHVGPYLGDAPHSLSGAARRQLRSVL